MKPLTVAPDAERLAVDYLTLTLAGRAQDATVGVNLPSAWTSTTKPHVQVALDGTPEVAYPILCAATLRITAWAGSTTTAKALAGLCMGLLLAHPGSREIGSVRPLTGVLPARDPDTGAQLASVTVRANLLMTQLA
ncbi:MAG: hypothetical protein ACOH10_07990 [Rhodoglobus sp.]